MNRVLQSMVTPLRKSLAWMLLGLLLGCSGGALGNLAGGGGDSNFQGPGGPLDGGGSQFNGSSTSAQSTQQGQLRPGPEIVLIKVVAPQRRTSDTGGAVTDNNSMMVMSKTTSDSGSTSTGQDPNSTGGKAFNVRDGLLTTLNADEVVLDRGPFAGDLPYVMVTQASTGRPIDTAFNQKYFIDPQQTDDFGNSTLALRYHPIGKACNEGAYTIWACWIDSKGVYYQSQSLTLSCPDGSSERPYGTNPGDADTHLYLSPKTTDASSPPQCPNVLGIQAVQTGVLESVDQ